MIPTQLDPRGDDRAVSPVIGVILMVAITVILAAVIGSFVLGIGGNQQAPPQVTLGAEEAANQVTFTHQGGEQIASDATLIAAYNGNRATTPASNIGVDGAFQAGESFTVGDDDASSSDLNVDGNFVNGEDVTIYVQAAGGGQEQAVRTYRLSNQ